MIQVIGSDLFQWDIGRSVCYTPDPGVEVNELHFAHQGDAKALVREVAAEGGTYTTEIPNILLQSGKPVRVWAVYAEEGSRHNVEQHVLPVRKREKPADYIYTEAEVLTWKELDKRLKAVEEGGIGGANTLTVTVTDDVASHTSAEIYAHAQSGSVVLEYEGERWSLNHCSEAFALFASNNTEEGVFTGVYVYEDGGIERFESVIPTSYRINSLIEAKLAANTLTVTITDDVASHTSAEIYAHVQAGGTAELDYEGFTYVLVGCTADYASFDHSYDDDLLDNFLIYGDGSVDRREYMKLGSAVLSKYMLAPTSAVVGQTIVVKSVDADGKPTVWEAADLPSDDHINSLIDAKLGTTFTEIDTLLGGES